MGKKKKSGPLYNYKSPRNYEVFNWGNEADPPFKLKSGNTPLFKHVGSSPLDENGDEDDKGKGEISRGWQVAIAGLTSGLDAVYGSGKIKFQDGKVKFSETEEEKKARLKREKEAALNSHGTTLSS